MDLPHKLEQFMLKGCVTSLFYRTNHNGGDYGI